MGILYNKSRSEKYKRYFSQIEQFEQSLNHYSVSKRNFQKSGKVSFWGKDNIGGIPLSGDLGKDLVAVDHTDAHSLIIGPTGSKKTRLIAMPTVRILGDAGESMIISDPKAEIYKRTAGTLAQSGYKVWVINLREPNYSRRWNPLLIPYRFYCLGDVDKAYEFANDIAVNMTASVASKEPFWENSAASLLFGLIMLLFLLAKDKGLSDEDITFDNIFEIRNSMFSGSDFEIKNSIWWHFAQKDDLVRNALIGTVETAKDTRGGILSTFDQALRSISIQPNLMNMLGDNEIDLDCFLNEKVALFMILPDEKTTYHKLVSLFVKQSYEYFIYLAQNEKENVGSGCLPRRINYILDEFSSLPTVNDFPAMITAARSRNIRFVLFIQSKHQMVQRYEDETETILANCINWIFLTTREISLLKDIEDLCGKRDGKPILSVAQLQRLNKDEGEVLILSGRNKPYVTRLPDIEIYDKGNFKIVPMKSAQIKNRTKLNIEELLGPKQIIRNGNFLANLDEETIDKMIADIDRKIKELDEEEKREKGKESNDEQ